MRSGINDFRIPGSSGLVHISSDQIKAVAHKLARACYHLLREGTPFDPARAFG